MLCEFQHRDFIAQKYRFCPFCGDSIILPETPDRHGTLGVVEGQPPQEIVVPEGKHEARAPIPSALKPGEGRDFR